LADRERKPLDTDRIEAICERVSAPLDRSEGRDIYDLREELEGIMWEHVGVVRNEESLNEGIERIKGVHDALNEVAVPGSSRYNLAWNEFMNVENLVIAAEMVARSARYRTESRGAHYREEHPDRDDENWLANVFVERGDDGMNVRREDVALTRLHPDDLSDGVTLPDKEDDAVAD